MTAAGRALGDVLSTAVSLLNPDIVVIGGDVVHAHERFMLGVRDTLLARTQPLAIARLTIAPSALGDRAGITGAAAMVADGLRQSGRRRYQPVILVASPGGRRNSDRLRRRRTDTRYVLLASGDAGQNAHNRASAQQPNAYNAAA
jgi:hypothetical protein